ncbi:MAG: phosphoesterase [Desulfuromonadales bacterium C00003094]|jgi:phosphoesterase RecJ-like protein|nr:MAG: phosphoesterase [Desulfuromonadales bacterium C00003094]OEU77978.1 MAG: phosphoesterase [Desulfuromonadales bacterium C00003107]
MIDAILSTIERGQRFLIASHGNPDGDALASTLALAIALSEMGKEVVAYNQDGLSDELSFLPGASLVVDTIAADQSFDAGFILDSGELRRAGSHLKDYCQTLVNIDHHPHSENFGSIYYVDETACATGALIYRILQAAGHAISQPVATCIYTAILTDTGSFRYSNADPEAFNIAAELVGLGVSPWEVSANIYENRPAEQLRLLTAALDTLIVSDCGRLGALSVTEQMLAETGTGPEHTDGLINYPRSIRGVKVALLFRQASDDCFKVGFRSKGEVNVGELARQLGGGGHHNAAGATLSGDLGTIQQMVFSRLQSLLP